MIPLTFAHLPVSHTGRCEKVDDKSLWIYNSYMEIKITCRSKQRKEALEILVPFYAKKLNLATSTWKVHVHVLKDLAIDNDCNGCVGDANDRNVNSIDRPTDAGPGSLCGLIACFLQNLITADHGDRQ